MKIRNASKSDISIIMSIMSQARFAQRKLGFRQWEDDYPSSQIILDDINSEAGYVLIDSRDRPIGYATIVINDSGYDCIKNFFKLKGNFAVVHRMAISDKYRGKGYANDFFLLLEQRIGELCINIVRVDTGEQNIPMIHTLKKRGYNNLGVLNYSWGPRYTFEKELDTATTSPRQDGVLQTSDE